MNEPLERDKCCGTCKHLKFTTSSKSCEVRGLPSVGLSYADCCKKYKFNESEIYKGIEVDKEKDCYFYRFTLNENEKIAYADTLNEIREIIWKLNNIDELFGTKEAIKTLDFLRFMREEIPDVYKKLRTEYTKMNMRGGG